MYITFQNVNVKFAVSVNHVKNISLKNYIYPLPLTNDLLLGITNIKGKLYPVINLSSIFSEFNMVSISKNLIILNEPYNFILSSGGKINLIKKLDREIEKSVSNDFIKSEFKYGEETVYTLNLELIKESLINILVKESK